MNQKTAKLIRKYAEATEANLNNLKREWNAMDQFARRDFRVQMQTEVDARVAAAAQPVDDPESPQAEVESEVVASPEA